MFDFAFSVLNEWETVNTVFFDGVAYMPLEAVADLADMISRAYCNFFLACGFFVLFLFAVFICGLHSIDAVSSLVKNHKAKKKSPDL